MPDGEIPLFPLKTVLCPEGRLPLQIFEPRYLDMVAGCMKRGHGFGVVAIRSGSEVGAAQSYSVGTEARIHTWDRNDNGLLALTVIGTERFRLTSVRRQEDGLYLGSAERLAAEPSIPLPEQYRVACEYLRRLMRRPESRPTDAEARFDDASWVGYRLTELLPLELSAKQSLLECDDPLERLAALASVVERLRTASV